MSNTTPRRVYFLLSYTTDHALECLTAHGEECALTLDAVDSAPMTTEEHTVFVDSLSQAPSIRALLNNALLAEKAVLLKEFRASFNVK